MYSLSAALDNLRVLLNDELPDAPGLRVFDLAVTLKDACDPLSWLCVQPLYPQFYWQHRDDNEEVAAIGAACRFTALAEARDFLQRQARPDLRIWGLNAFAQEQGQLFLPRLEWRRDAGRSALRLTLYSASSLRDDARSALTLLDALRPERPLPVLALDLTRERHLPERAGWQRLIEQATGAIADGALQKVVLARASDLSFTAPPGAGPLMAASRRRNLNCYHFMMASGPQQAFFGSSPERLWRREENLLWTEALAGTVASHPDPRRAQGLADWLMSDEKNQRENLLVVEDICQRLGDEASELEVAPPEVIRLRKVQHLRRKVQGRLRRPDDLLCLRQLQPTAAVAGLPRRAAREFIARHEPFEREWYAGSAGYLSLRGSEFCVALRSARLSDNVLRLYAGAGIIAGSDPQQEWQEIENKAAGLRTLLFEQ